jgi:hypothetical protein
MLTGELPRYFAAAISASTASKTNTFPNAQEWSASVRRPATAVMRNGWIQRITPRESFA